MVGEGEGVSAQKLFEAEPCGLELYFGVLEPRLREQYVGKTPADLRIAARQHWQKQRLRVAGSALARMNLREMHARLHIVRQVSNGASIPQRGEIRVGLGHELSPQHAELKADPRQRKR